jgi:hypothetical protein
MIRQSAIDAVVDSAGVEAGLKLRIDRLRVVLVKPQVEFFSLLRSKGSAGKRLNLMDGGQPAVSLTSKVVRTTSRRKTAINKDRY